jgi:hypothetical protein
MLLSTLKFAIPTFFIAACLVLTSPSSQAKPEYTKKEKRGCTTCHITQGKKELNDTGKCYAEHDHSLDACAPKK